MIRHRLLFISFIFFFSLAGPLNALAACSLEKETFAKNTSGTPTSISCMDNQQELFLSQVYQGHKKIYFPKMERRAMNAHRATFLQEVPSYPNPLGPSGAVFVPLSIPIYQLKTAYRI